MKTRDRKQVVRAVYHETLFYFFGYIKPFPKHDAVENIDIFLFYSGIIKDGDEMFSRIVEKSGQG